MTKKPGIDLYEVVTTGIGVGAIAGIVTLVISLINRNKRKKAGAVSAMADLHNEVWQNPGNPAYPDNRQYPGNQRQTDPPHSGNPPEEGPQGQP